jgi:arylsulfatase
MLENDKPNVILIVIDALRARNLGCYGQAGNHPSPHLDALAGSGILFERTYATWNTTDPSLTCILTGRYPRSNGIMDHGDRATADVRNRFAETGTPLAAEILKGSGYETAAVDWMGRWFKRGFDHYGYRPERSPARRLAHGLSLPGIYVRYALDHLPILQCYRPVRRPSWSNVVQGLKDVLSTFAFTYRLAEIQDAASVTRLARDFLNRPHPNPFFLFLHYWDTHTPYHCPRSFLAGRTDLREPKSLLAARYSGAVSYVDLQLGRLFATLKELNLWDNTLLVVTSDHGDSLTEHEIYFDHHGLYEETTHVPLILHYPARWAAARRLSSLVQHVDLLPTICEIAGIAPPAGADGVSLVPLIEGELDSIRDAVFIEESYVQRKAALRTERYKYIQAVDGAGWCRYCEKVHVGVEELYDLLQDPGEKTDLSQSHRALADEMKGRLNGMIARLDLKREQSKGSRCPRNHDAAKTLEPKEEQLIKKRLKSLGYLSE